MYKYKTVKELVELGIFEYSINTMSIYLKRPEFTEFRQYYGSRNVKYLHCPKFMKAWYKFSEELDESRKNRKIRNMEKRKVK